MNQGPVKGREGIMEFGKRIQRLRKSNPHNKVFKAEELAHLLKISEARLRNIEQGRTTGIDIGMLKQLTRIFGVSYRYLIEGTEDYSENNLSEPHARILTKLQDSEELAFLMTELLDWDKESVMTLFKAISRARKLGYQMGYEAKENELEGL